MPTLLGTKRGTDTALVNKVLKLKTHTHPSPKKKTPGRVLGLFRGASVKVLT
jgi:hypothetical protein